MGFSIGSITNSLATTAATAPKPSPASSASGGFGSALQGAIQSIEQSGKQAETATVNFLNGDGEELHTVALSVQKASLDFDLGLQIRNKVVSAYQEIMRMQM